MDFESLSRVSPFGPDLSLVDHASFFSRVFIFISIFIFGFKLSIGPCTGILVLNLGLNGRLILLLNLGLAGALGVAS